MIYHEMVLSFRRTDAAECRCRFHDIAAMSGKSGWPPPVSHLLLCPVFLKDTYPLLIGVRGSGRWPKTVGTDGSELIRGSGHIPTEITWPRPINDV